MCVVLFLYFFKVDNKILKHNLTLKNKILKKKKLLKIKNFISPIIFNFKHQVKRRPLPM